MPTPPWVFTQAPEDLWEDSAVFNAYIQSDGGYTVSGFFQWAAPRVPGVGPHETPIIGAYNSYDTFSHKQHFTSTGWQISYRAGILSPEGRTYGDWIDFWLPHKTRPDFGAPFIITHQSGNWINSTLQWICSTDIPCHMTIWVSGGPWKKIFGFHYKRGVEMYHDVEPFFFPMYSLEQAEAGDTTMHTFEIPFDKPGARRYWYATATVDGKQSPSASPQFYTFLSRAPVQCQGDDDGYPITRDLWGKSWAMRHRPKDTYELYGIRIKLGIAADQLWGSNIHFKIVTAENGIKPSDNVISTGELRMAPYELDTLYTYVVLMDRVPLYKNEDYFMVLESHRWPANPPDPPHPGGWYYMHQTMATGGPCKLSSPCCWRSSPTGAWYCTYGVSIWRFWWQPLRTPKQLLQITTTSLPNGKVGVPYSQTLQAEGGTGFYTWSLWLSGFPPGLTLHPTTGVIDGTPAIAGTTEFYVVVSDELVENKRMLKITIEP